MNLGSKGYFPIKPEIEHFIQKARDYFERYFSCNGHNNLIEVYYKDDQYELTCCYDNKSVPMSYSLHEIKKRRKWLFFSEKISVPWVVIEPEGVRFPYGKEGWDDRKLLEAMAHIEEQLPLAYAVIDFYKGICQRKENLREAIIAEVKMQRAWMNAKKGGK